MSVRDQIQKLIDSNTEASEALDEFVHEVAGEMAASANNDGLKSQLEFVEKQGYTDEDVLEHLKEELA